MTIDERLREAAQEARVAVAALEAPAPARARRAARWRGPLAAAAAAVVVVAVVAGVALLRDGATVPSTVAPAGPDPTAPAEEPADAAPVIPADAALVPIGAAGAADVEAALRAAEEAEGMPAEVLGAVGETVLLTVDRGGGELCLVAVDGPQVRSACGEGGPTLGYAIRQLPDGTHMAVVSGRLPADASVVVVSAGDARYAQEARNGWVHVPFDAAAAPVRIEAFTADGRPVADFDADAAAAERVQAVVRLQLVERAAELRRNPDPLEQAVLDAQLEAVETPIVEAGEAESYEALLALAEQRLDDIRREVEARPPPASADGPRVIPTRPEVTAALGDTLAVAAPPQPRTVWVTGALRVEDGTELPALLFEVDPASGSIVGTHEVGLPMQHLAAGDRRVWFGRTGDGALPQSAVGYLDLPSGRLEIVETDLNIADIVRADDLGLVAWLVGGEPGAPVVAKLGPAADAVPAPLSLDFEPGSLLTAVAWPGGMVIADDAGTLWLVDADSETVAPFAELGGVPFTLEPAWLVNGRPAVWALVGDGAAVRAVLLGPDGEPLADYPLPGDTTGLAAETRSTGAFALTAGGDVWFLDVFLEPVLVTTVEPGSPDTGFAGIARSGTALWLRGGTAGLVWLELGQ